MKIREVLDYLESIAPPALQESYDNAGLIVGNANEEVSGILVCLDSTPEVIAEAKAKGCNLVVAHHPIVFSGLKKLNGKNYVERAVMQAIKSDVAIYAIHTNLDNVLINGVNQKMAEKLGLVNGRILAPMKGALEKLVVFVPDAHAEAIRLALFKAGAGHIGNYDACSFNTRGEGSFRGNEHSSPYVGEKGKLHYEEETRIETVYPAHLRSVVVKAMLSQHPYEEVAYDIYKLENTWHQAGSGLVAELAEPIPMRTFLDKVKVAFQAGAIRYTESAHQEVKRVALCGGSGSFLLPQAKASGAQVFLSSDFKYHQFFDGEDAISIVDIGHYEGEYFTIELLGELLRKKFNTFAVIFSDINTNPIKYHS
ncbi:MAG: Nif3-like dinuclear metal center hexameric protein [Bacteroidetes bacterium]|nr:MAG: Nif3-like dinuclear metal center hexameric protein [Bacteroidota bacterium]